MDLHFDLASNAASSSPGLRCSNVNRPNAPVEWSEWASLRGSYLYSRRSALNRRHERPAGWYASSLELLIYPHLCKWRWRARIAAVGYCVMNIWYVWFIATQLGDGWSIMAALCWRDWAREERRWWHESQHRTKEAGELRNTKKRGSPQNRFTGSDVCPERVRNVAPRCRIREGLKRWWKQKAYPTFSSCVGGKYPFKTYIRCFFLYINHSH